VAEELLHVANAGAGAQEMRGAAAKCRKFLMRWRACPAVNRTRSSKSCPRS
jgi:hypothetical protein